MTEQQGQSAHYSRQISTTSDDFVGTTSSIKFLMSPYSKMKSTVFTSSRWSKILVVIGLIVIIAIISVTLAMFSSRNEKGNNKVTYFQLVTLYMVSFIKIFCQLYSARDVTQAVKKSSLSASQR